MIFPFQVDCDSHTATHHRCHYISQRITPSQTSLFFVIDKDPAAAANTHLHNTSLRGVYCDHGSAVQHKRNLVVWVVCHSQLLHTHTHRQKEALIFSLFRSSSILLLKLSNTDTYWVEMERITQIGTLTFILASIHFILVAAKTNSTGVIWIIYKIAVYHKNMLIMAKQ